MTITCRYSTLLLCCTVLGLIACSKSDRDGLDGFSEVVDVTAPTPKTVDQERVVSVTQQDRKAHV